MKFFYSIRSSLCPPVLNPVKTGCIDGLSRRANMYLHHTMAHRLNMTEKVTEKLISISTYFLIGALLDRLCATDIEYDFL